MTLPFAPSVRTLCDNLRRERDRAVSELAEALRSLDDTRKQKNDVSRELKELKYAGVGAAGMSWHPGSTGPPTLRAQQPQGQAWPPVPFLGQSIKCVPGLPLC